MTTSQLTRSPALDFVSGIEGAASVVNDSSESTAEHLAGQYAFEAAREAGYGFDEQTLEAHLGFLHEAGAVFDELKALRVALKWVGQQDA